MDDATKREVRGRTKRLESYDKESALLDKYNVKAMELFTQRYYYVVENGARVRKRMTKPMRNALHNRLVDRMFPNDGIDITEDAKEQLRLMDEGDDS